MRFSNSVDGCVLGFLLLLLVCSYFSLFVFLIIQVLRSSITMINVVCISLKNSTIKITTEKKKPKNHTNNSKNDNRKSRLFTCCDPSANLEIQQLLPHYDVPKLFLQILGLSSVSFLLYQDNVLYTEFPLDQISKLLQSHQFFIILPCNTVEHKA